MITDERTPADNENNENFFNEFKEKMAIDPLDSSVHHVKKKASKAQTITIIVLVCVAITAGLCWNFYGDYTGQNESIKDIPLLKADNAPDKVRPESAGGMQVDNMDKLVYGRLASEGASSDNYSSEGYERILPSSEKPVAPSAVPAPTVTSSDEEDPLADMIEQINAEETSPSLNEETAKQGQSSSKQSVASQQVKEEVTKIASASTAVAPSAPAQEVKIVVTEEEVVETVSVPADVAKAVNAPQTQSVTVSKTVTRTQVEVEDTPFRVQILSSKDKKAVENAWKKLLAKNADILSGFNHEIVSAEVPNKGTFYRLRIKGFASRDMAQKLCSSLKARGQDCLVTGK